MKGLITAAGLGTRSGLNGRIRKEMLPIYERENQKIYLRPMLDVIYGRMKSCGISDIMLVLNPGDAVTREYVRQNLGDATIVFQESPEGYGNAVLQARDSAGDEDILLSAGDGLILDSRILRSVVDHHRGGCIELLLFRVSEPSRYGVAEIEGDTSGLRSLQQSSDSSVTAVERIGDVTFPVLGVEEKPQHPKSDLALCANYILPASIFDSLEKSRTGTEELTPAIDLLLKSGVPAHGIVLPTSQWVSVGRAEEYAAVLSRSLDWARRL